MTGKKGKGKKRVHELNFLRGRFEFLSTVFYVLSGCFYKLFLSWALPFFIHSLECGVYDLFHGVHLLVYFASKPHRITCFILVINETNRTEPRLIPFATMTANYPLHCNKYLSHISTVKVGRYASASWSDSILKYSCGLF